jgi:hypothetical protein
MPLNNEGIPQPNNTLSEQGKKNYESIFGPSPKAVASGTYAMVDGKLTLVSGGHGVERSSRSAISSKNPLRSEALSVPAHEAKKFSDAAKRNKTGAVYDKDGTCYLTSRGARNREMRAQNRYDRDAGYGDYGGR